MPSVHSNSIARRHVGASGPQPARILAVGEAPGQTENALGIPFCGQAGEELNSHLRYAGLERGDIRITNLIPFWPLCDVRGKQLPPSAAEITQYEAELLTEIMVTRPAIIAPIGAHAARYFLGDEFHSIFRDRGIPRRSEKWAADIIVLTHPAAALHSQSQEERARVAWDFQQLGKLVRGQINSRRVNPWPAPVYRELSGSEGAVQLADLLAGRTEISLDTEGTVADPECTTLCITEGEGWLIRAAERECLDVLNRHINAPGGICTVMCHYLGHDIPVLEAMGVYVNKHRALNSDGSLTLRCTMSELFLLGGTEPKGLKPAIWRNCNMDQEDYADVVGPTEERNARAYIERAFAAVQCARCYGLGKVPGIGKKGQPLKSDAKCPDCTDGLHVPLPDKELVFDQQKAQFRLKQPQSVARWMRRRLEKGASYDELEDAWQEGTQGTEDGAAEISEEQGGAGGEDASAYFKLRRDWNALPANTRSLIETSAGAGRMPRTRLFSVPDMARVRHYACADADGGLRLSRITTARLNDLGLNKVRLMDAAIIPMLARMERLGMRIDREHFKELSADLGVEMSKVQHELSKLLGTPTNPNSPALAKVLFEELGLPIIKLTKTGTRGSIDDDVLSTLKSSMQQRTDPEAQIAVQIIDHIQNYRELQKLKSTYADPILEHADSDDRVHCTVNYATVATGRLSFSDPINLSTLPNPDNSPVWGKRVRDGIIARPNYILIEADYSQIEMVYGAHLSQDTNLCAAVREGRDLHKAAASMMYGIPYDEVPKPVRTQVKPVNFGAFYGIGPEKLMMQLASLPSGAVIKTVAECEDMITRYYRDFAPGVMDWKRAVWQQARIDGYVREPLSGRIRWMTGLRSDIRKVHSAAERECANFPVQSGAQSIIKIAMRIIWEQTLPVLWAEGIDAEVIMQNHDALLIEVPEEHGELVGWMMSEAMRTAVQLSVPVKVSVKSGSRWGSL